MAFDIQVLESLLHQPEGPALDFKQEQYRFDKATPEQKAELLKDILALANSWRLTTAYLLIGVREIKGGRSEIVGVEEHLDDASLHQFVNGRTQKSVEFSCFSFRTEGKKIDVIEIPKQERPIFVTNRLGPLRKYEVPVRAGSSTREATPDEIAKMGAEQVLGTAPQFTLEWADVDEHKGLLSPHALHSLMLDPSLPGDTFTPSRLRGRFHWADMSSNSTYSEEVISYAFERNLFKPLGFRLRNESGVSGKRIRFTGFMTKSGGISIREWLHDLPSPTRDFPLDHITPSTFSSDEFADLSTKELRDRWEITIDFGDVRPRDEVWTDGSLYVGSDQSCTVKLQGELRGDNLSDPIKCELELIVEAERRAMSIGDVVPYVRTEWS